MSKQKEVVLLIVFVLILLWINYSFLDRTLKEFLLDDEFVSIVRVIDGDTIVNETSIRLLGINSPEKGEPYYLEAKLFLEELVLGKEVKLEFGKEKYDKYNRTLAYVFIDAKNVNSELVKNGLANFYFPSEKDVHYEEFKKAWEMCIEENVNLCEKSEDECFSCIELKEFDYKEEKIVFHNRCEFDCNLTDWKIKDEGRKKFNFPEFVLKFEQDAEVRVGGGEDNESVLFWKMNDYVWTNSGDTLFLRDSKNKLVLWESY